MQCFCDLQDSFVTQKVLSNQISEAMGIGAPGQDMGSTGKVYGAGGSMQAVVP